jgi:hypothetical protein
VLGRRFSTWNPNSSSVAFLEGSTETVWGNPHRSS